MATDEAKTKTENAAEERFDVDHTKLCYPNIAGGTARVFGDLVSTSDGIQLHVACPFCHRVHIHGPSHDHPVYTGVPTPAPKGYQANKPVWITTREATCLQGEYTIVGEQRMGYHDMEEKMGKKNCVDECNNSLCGTDYSKK